jgi:hypothetical protein
VLGRDNERGIEIVVYNPYDYEILVTNIVLDGSREVAGTQPLTSYMYEIQATVTGQSIVGKAKEVGTSISQQVRGGWVDNGINLGAVLKFNPNVGVRPKENGKFDLFVNVTNATLSDSEIGIGVAHPSKGGYSQAPISPTPGSLFNLYSALLA